MKKLILVFIFMAFVLGSNVALAVDNTQSSTKMCTKFTRTLKYGYGFTVIKNRAYVKELQQALADAGLLKGKIDGLFGRKTESVLKEYQKQNGLKETGILDSDTINFMRARFCNASSGGGATSKSFS
jgi:peptidoglycan hydrolase-like protein with peptidoglycan-binding domain